MADLILQLIILSSFAAIVYLMAIAVPRVKDDELEAPSKVIGALPLERMDAFLNNWKEKILRRLRIYLLKAERSVTDQLQKSKEAYQRERQKKRPFPKFKRTIKSSVNPEDQEDQENQA